MAQAVLYAEIVPTTKGLSKAVEKEMSGGFDATEKKGKGLFGRITGFAKGAGIAVAGAAAAITGLAVKGGFERMLRIEDATAKLTGLGHSVESVETIMNSALASVKGTAFGLDEAATIAASAVAAGVEPGIQLEKYLRLTADAATIAGISLGEMGSILNKVTANGFAMTDNLNQLQDRGIPILKWLADEYGVTTAEMSKMVSQGKVDAETFAKVIEENIGGSALTAGDTTRGAFANMMAALSRVGVAMLEGIFPFIQPALVGVTGFLDTITDKIGPFSEAVASTLGPVFETVGAVVGRVFAVMGPYFETLGAVFLPILQSLGGAFMTVWEAIGPLVGTLAELWMTSSPIVLLFEALAPLMPQIAATLGMVAGVVAEILVVAMEALAPILAVVMEVVAALMPVFASLIPPVLSIVEAIMPLVLVLVELLAPILGWVAEIIGIILVPVIEILGGIIKVLADIIVWLVDEIVIPFIIGVMVPAIEKWGEVFAWVYENIIKPMFESFAANVTTVVDIAMDVFGALGDFFGGLWGSIGAGFKGFINFIIDGINGFTGGLNEVGNFVSDITGGAIDFHIARLPHLALGALIEPTVGGTAVIAAEAGYSEAVIPLGGPQLDKIREALHPDDRTDHDRPAPTDEGPVDLSDESIDKLAQAVTKYRRTDDRMG